MTLDQVMPGNSARVNAIDWLCLADDEGKRLRALGLDEGAEVTVMHRGVFGGRDPLALRIGEMTIAVRLSHASAMTVTSL